MTKKGEAMVYGITIVKGSPNEENAIKFVDFLLNNNKGMQVMVNNGQASVIPAYSETYDRVPEELKKYVKNKK